MNRTIFLCASYFTYNFIKFLQDAFVFLAYDEIDHENCQAIRGEAGDDFIHFFAQADLLP